MTATTPHDYSITIKNCNSIVEANITIKRNSLNVKHGANGVGKSTIAKALLANATGQGLQDLLPFKHRQGGDLAPQTILGADGINKVLVFNEDYVSQFVFQEDEVVKNSFEIFINTPEYRKGIAELETIFEDLKLLFAENAALDKVIENLKELKDAFTITKSGGIAKTSKGYKAFRVGGKLDAIPTTYSGFEKFLRSENPAGWLAWQSKGHEYLALSDNCPFCATSNLEKSIAISVANDYNSSAVKNMGLLRDVIDNLAGLFVPAHLERLRTITRSLDEPSQEQLQFLANLHGQVNTLLNKFQSLKNLSFISLREEANLDETIRTLKVDLELLDSLNSDSLRTVAEGMNEQLDHLAQQINEIKRRIGVQKSQVARSTAQHQVEINDYLRSAGYRYFVRIEPSEDSYRMILEHQDAPGHLEAAGSHLSYGERNAFAMVLFMHQVRRELPDLIILDDPVSSFDKTKKFAILYKLFHGRESLRGFTTLLLTHDIEPAIDILRAGTSAQFQAAEPLVHSLRNSGGILTEKTVNSTDILTFSEVCDRNIASTADDLVKCIYLRRRYEMSGERGIEYDLISSLLHLRQNPKRKVENGGLVTLDQEEYLRAEAQVERIIPGFDYQRILSDLTTPGALKMKFEETSVGYEKVQIFRVAMEQEGAVHGDAAFRKFVNESYHIENEYLMQLNPRDFDTVPEHIIEECAAFFD